MVAGFMLCLYSESWEVKRLNSRRCLMKMMGEGGEFFNPNFAIFCGNIEHMAHT